MHLEVLTLNKSLIPKVKELVSGYLNSSPNGKDQYSITQAQLENSEYILDRLLTFDLAECYLAKYENDYIGFIVLSWSFSISKGCPVLRIEALYSLPKYRQKGVAKKLLQHAINLAREKKATRLQLETDDENIPARTLYTNLGFEMINGKGVYMLFLNA